MACSRSHSPLRSTRSPRPTVIAHPRSGDRQSLGSPPIAFQEWIRPMENKAFQYQPTCSATDCTNAAAYKVAAPWSNGTSRELKNYGLACEQHRDSLLAAGPGASQGPQARRRRDRRTGRALSARGGQTRCRAASSPRPLSTTTDTAPGPGSANRGATPAATVKDDGRLLTGRTPPCNPRQRFPRRETDTAAPRPAQPPGWHSYRPWPLRLRVRSALRIRP